MKKQYKLHLIGNAHIDSVWLWRWQEGYAEIKASFQSALDRLNEFPDFIFTSGCASYYKWIEENDPQMFGEIKSRIEEGRWCVTGGMWNQPDCNIPSGESFARQTLYGQRYFLKKFGIIAKVGYNVDSFGHNGMLPQILKKSGMDYYVFQRPEDHEKDLPSNLFLWESQDGSKVLTFRIPFGYGSNWDKNVLEKIKETRYMTKDQSVDFMCLYGVGNHGGGPTIQNIKDIKLVQGKDGGENVIFSSPDEYFDSLKDQVKNLPVIKDDLQYHARGCYSAHWEIKADNRKSEHILLSAEKFSSIAHHILGYPYPSNDIGLAWEKIMFNHFHDILGGCSIKEAYDDAKHFHGWALHTGEWIQNGAIQKISWAIDTMKDDDIQRSKDMNWQLWEYDNRGTPFVVFNPLSWEVQTPVQVNALVKGVTDEKGNSLPFQVVRGSQTNRDDKWNTLFEAKIPALGYRVYWVYLEKELYDTNKYKQKESHKNVIENSYIRLEIEENTGYISSLYDKENHINILKDKGAVPIAVDVYHCDTWAHDISEFSREVGRFTDADIELMEFGPLRRILRVTSKYNNSILRQDFIMYKNKKYIEVRVKLDWREKHKMLKLSFPVNVENPIATYEIPYGFIHRPTTGEEEPGQQWIDVTGNINTDQYGLALLNDSKYSFSIKNSDMRMTIANSSAFADHFGNRDKWCEFLDQGIQEFSYALVPHKGDWKEEDVVKKAYELNVKPIGIMETYHKGPLPSKLEGICISAHNIIATVFKRAEEDDGYILRCYETWGRDAKANISIPMLNRQWTAKFYKCEIKTFWIPDDVNGKVIEKNLIEI